MIGADEARQAVRTLARRRASTLLTVLLAAVGSAGVVASVSVGRHLLVPPLPYAAPEQLMSVDVSAPAAHAVRGLVSVPVAADWRSLPPVQSLSAFTVQPSGVQLASGAQFDVSVARVSCELLQTLRTSGPRDGRFFDAEDCRAGAAAVAVLSDGGARLLEDTGAPILGQRLRVGRAPHTIVGVLPPSFRFPAAAQPDVFVPLNLSQAPASAAFARAVLRLDAEARAGDIERRLHASIAATPAWARLLGDAFSVRLTPIRDTVAADIRTTTWMVMWLAATLYGLSAASLAGLHLCDLAADRPAMRTRRACGATPARLFQSVVVQRGVLAAVSSAAALALLIWWTQALAAVLPEIASYAPVMHASTADGVAVVMAAVVLVIVPLLLSVFVIARMSIEREAAPMELRFRQATLALQVACAIAVTSVAASLVGTLWKATGAELGFDYRLAPSVKLRLLDIHGHASPTFSTVSSRRCGARPACGTPARPPRFRSTASSICLLSASRAPRHHEPTT